MPGCSLSRPRQNDCAANRLSRASVSFVSLLTTLLKANDAIMSAAAATPKKAKKPAKKPDHPSTASMVNAAIKNLKERKGSSLAAIKKYIAANYKVDVNKLAPFIRRYLKKAVADGKLTQTKGSGASGSFKIGKATEEKKEKKVKKTPKKAVKKPAAKKSPKKAKKPAAKKEKKAKKPKAAKPKKPKAKKAATKSPKKPAKKPAAKKAAK